MQKKLEKIPASCQRNEGIVEQESDGDANRCSWNNPPKPTK